MLLYEKLSIPRGVTAVIGSGGKTTLLRTLSRELPGTVLLATTTHILPFEGVPLVTDGGEAAVRRALAESRVVCVGTPAAEGKLTAPALPFSVLTRLTDYVLVEADGSRRLPLKAHAPHEPVIPPQSNQTILVLGAEGLGRTVAQAAHRPALYARLAGAEEGSVVTPALAARMLRAEGLHDRVFVNQADDWERWADAVRALAAELDCPVAAGSLRRGVWRRVQ